MPGDSWLRLVSLKSFSVSSRKKNLENKFIKMKFLVVVFALVCAAAARPQFFPGGGFSGGAANAAAGSQSFK